MENVEQSSFSQQFAPEYNALYSKIGWKKNKINFSNPKCSPWITLAMHSLEVFARHRSIYQYLQGIAVQGRKVCETDYVIYSPQHESTFCS